MNQRASMFDPSSGTSDSHHLKAKPMNVSQTPSLRIAQFRFDLEAVDPLYLPAYKGSTFRGGFGHAFKKMVCAQANWRACTPCARRNRCPYGYIFDSTAPENSALFQDLRDVPIPFLIEAGSERKTTYHPGDRLSFNVVLIGRAISYLPYFVLAYQELGRMGIGHPAGRYVLQRIMALHPWERKEMRVFDGVDVDVGADLSISFEDVMEQATYLPGDQVSLRFLTPTRIKHQGRYIRQPDFHVLIRTLLRRISSLVYFHGGEVWTPDLHHLIAQAEAIQTTNLAVHWVDWDRFSGRQQQRIELSGFVGSATYRGNLEPFHPLLALGEIVHIGKATVFGHGQYQIDRSGILAWR